MGWRIKYEEEVEQCDLEVISTVVEGSSVSDCIVITQNGKFVQVNPDFIETLYNKLIGNGAIL